MNDSALPVIGM